MRLATAPRLLALNLTLLALIAATPLAAESAALTSDGSLLQVQAGAYGELFPGSTRYRSDSAVLVLDVTRVNGSTVRHLIPGTEGTQIESAPTILWDGGQAFVLWSSANASRSALQLISFDGSSWSQGIEVSGDAGPMKGLPRIKLTRDAYTSDDGATSRTIVHVVWWEQEAGAIRSLYTPILLVDGSYLGWNPVVPLGVFDINADASAPASDDALFQAPDILTGSDQRSVIIALAQQRSNRVMALRIRVQPDALLELADETRDFLITFGGLAGENHTILTIADAARSHIIGMGRSPEVKHRLFRGIRDYIGSEVHGALAGAGTSFDPDNDLDALGNLAWRTIISSGAAILGHGLRAEIPLCSLLHLGSTPEIEELSRHQIEICLVSDRAAPETAPGAQHTLLTSSDGSEVIVAWVGVDGVVHYRYSESEDWSEPQTMARHEGVSLEQALHLLRQQIRVD
jgi:hypothetical protein